jgi:hypothetical protein
MAGSDSSTTANSNRNFVSRDGRSATFDRSMTSYLNSRSTNSYDILDSDENKNTKYKYFKKVGMRRAEAISKNSIALSNDFNNTAYGMMHKDSSFGDVMYATVSEDKPGRLRDYRSIAAYSEVSDALDEICDECVNYDENSNILKLLFVNDNLKSIEKEKIAD